jgi:hypothetical protein
LLDEGSGSLSGSISLLIAQVATGRFGKLH